MPLFLTILGALATAGGVFLQAEEARKARRRADEQFEILRKNQKKFEDQANERLRKSINDFTPADREALKNRVVLENEETLGSALARDRTVLNEDNAGNVSQQFIDRRAKRSQGLLERGERKVGLRARVLAPGIANFFEKENLLEASGEQNTNRLFARGRLSVDANAVNVASIPRGNLLADILLGLGPSLVSAGVLGGFNPASVTGPGTIPASSLSLLTEGGLVGAGGATGFSGLNLGEIIAAGTLGGLPKSTSGGPRRGFAP